MAVMNLVIDEDKKEELEQIAASKGLALSGLVRMVLYDFISKEEKGE